MRNTLPMTMYKTLGFSGRGIEEEDVIVAVTIKMNLNKETAIVVDFRQITPL